MSEQKTAEEIALKSKAFLVDQKYLAVTVTNQYEVDYVVKWLKVFNPNHMLILNNGMLGIGDSANSGIHISLTAGYLSASCDEEAANKFGCTLIHFYEFKDKVEQYQTKQTAALQERVKDLESESESAYEKYAGHVDFLKDKVYTLECQISNALTALKP